MPREVYFDVSLAEGREERSYTIFEDGKCPETFLEGDPRVTQEDIDHAIYQEWD